MSDGEKKKEPNQFVSLIPNIRNTRDVRRKLREALKYQFMFRKSTTPWERAELDPTPFILEPEDIDRVYHLHTRNNDGREFEFIGRTNGSLYVELLASCDNTGFECQGKGRIFISRNPWLFFNSIEYRHNDIDEQLRVDGTPVEILPRYDKFGAPYPMMTLQHLCHDAIYQGDPNPTVVEGTPKMIRDAIDEYGKMRRAQEEYDDYYVDTDTEDEDEDND